MKTSSTLLVLIILISGGLTSCVTQKKYDDLSSEKDRLTREYNNTLQSLKETTVARDALTVKLKSAESQIAQLESDLKLARERYTQLDNTNKDLLARYDRIIAENEKLLASASDEKQALTTALAEKQRELDQRERQLRKLEMEASTKESRLDQLSADLESREERVRELESAIAEKDAKLTALRERVNQALLGFSATDLQVTEKNGKVYVSLSQNLLFSSGSKTINSAGRNALAKVAEVLTANPDINITVEGHTDSDGDANFNWDLSVGRATSIVKELTKNGVDPKRVTASGRGEYFPVATNETAQGKAQNRRTEIILEPNLDALYELINN
ncbi:OmpA family protein [Flavilitoribacter nigricans]|uniref:Flagellar motor protein MotB n=1 Tax=Flavilitoribacter nigricans (strain ATCC 23147 / DSM 23189 / NBRC 102662 / NCIMB 1420 / SS-2) TaxID=1122177 RepID=A0A2D0MYP6_FLAN2|nr:OmpA family protein [Flavilitoribacter nigricans]PHN01401.1 flagellar motor protein MotB [Flavilitoribacter nigricans DSM 23189 = NBRC 102662]